MKMALSFIPHNSTLLIPKKQTERVETMVLQFLTMSFDSSSLASHDESEETMGVSPTSAQEVDDQDSKEKEEETTTEQQSCPAAIKKQIPIDDPSTFEPLPPPPPPKCPPEDIPERFL